MFDSSNVVVGLETGTSKVCAVVGEINDNGALSIVGIGQAKSRGVRKGEVVDATLAEEDIRNAIVEAEQMANVEIRSLYLGVTGNHIQCVNNRGVHTVLSSDREIAEEDVQDVIKNAKAISLPPGNHVVHAVRQHFSVDGQRHIDNPVGYLGNRVEVDMHVVHGQKNRLQNPIRLVKHLQLEVETVVFNGLASTLALLTNEQKEHGSLVIDIGGGTTEYVVCARGIIRYSGVLAVGGDHITNDLAIGLKLPMHLAEELKKMKGQAIVDESLDKESAAISSEPGLPERIVNLGHLTRIMSARVEEILELILEDATQSGAMDEVRAGVFLSGGGSRIPRLQPLAERIFELPAFLGRTCGVNGLQSNLDQPEFVTAIGLVKFGVMQQKQKDNRVLSRGLRTRLTQLFKRD